MERRKFKRVNARLPVYYKRFDSEKFSNSECRNISEDGFRMILKKPESIERMLQFKLLMPEGHDIVDAVGKVIWLKEGKELEAGVEILDVGTGYKDRIKTLFM